MDSRTTAAVLALITRTHTKSPKSLGKIASNLILNDVYAFLTEKNWTVAEVMTLRQDYVNNLSDIAYLRAAELISTKHVRTLITRAWEVVELDLVEELRDSKILEEVNGDQLNLVIDQVFADNAKILDQIRAGKTNAIGALIGKTMKAIGGKGDPATISTLINERLATHH